MYTTNAIESVNLTLRKVTRNHRIFPSDEAVYKVLYLAIQHISKWNFPRFRRTVLQHASAI
jgi:transposase-like protein